MALLQGGGGSLLTPGTPGPNLPNLNAARNVASAEPVAPAPVDSTQACSTCTPCTGTCDPAYSHAPVAFTSGPYSERLPKGITFNAGGSFDPDGDTLTYSWNFGDGGTGGGQSPKHTYVVSGTYNVTLTVTDSHGQTGSAATTATVSPANTPPPPPPPPTVANDAAFIQQSTLPAQMYKGTRYNVWVKMRNVGSSTWTAAHLYRLGAVNDSSTWVTGRVVLPSDVAPGDEVTFSFTIIAPLDPGSYNYQWRMVQDGVEWFGAPTPQGVSGTVVAPSGDEPPSIQYSDINTARLSPFNRMGAGDDLLSRNFNFSLPLVNLPGRAGQDLDLALSYNSLVWTKFTTLPTEWYNGPQTTFQFDADQGFPGPGFRLGFPAIQGPYSVPGGQVGAAYMLITPAGRHVELRQQEDGSFEAADSSHGQLLAGDAGQLLVRSTDGTQLTYVTVNNEYRCTGVKDRNGNYLTIGYNAYGRIASVTDTLGRVVNFNYDANNRLLSITQQRGAAAHAWATFGYGTITVQTSFVADSLTLEGGAEGSGQPAIYGPQNDTQLTVLTQVGLDDGSRYNFNYNSYGQVFQINHYAADGHLLAYTAYDLPVGGGEPQTDCPRFTARSDWAENWNDGALAVTRFFTDWDENGQWFGVSRPDAPDVVAYKEYYVFDWDALVVRAESYDPASPAAPQKVVTTAWTQDDPRVAYQTNPRPTRTTITDAAGNTRQTDYNYTSFGLVSDVYERGGAGGAGGLTLYRRTHLDYNLSPAYVSRRIIGLVRGQYVFGPEDNAQRLYSKTTYLYDAGGEFLQEQGNPVGHDAAYGPAFSIGRGNVTSMLRWDANSESDASKALTTSIGYNTAGAAIFTRDAADHQTSISYQDAFSNGGNLPLTLAYPTSVTDADGFTSTVKFDYHLGLVTRAQGPPPQGVSEGAIQATSYDAAGRVKQASTFLSSTAEQANTPYRYTRFVYPAGQTIVNTFATVQDGAGEVYSATVLDGAGRVRATASDLPNAPVGQYAGRYTLYNVLGQAVRQYRPTEMTNLWGAAGDDAAGWYYTLQAYDWQGRPTVTTNVDMTTRTAEYGGCGCAGGAMVTLTDEVGRQQRVTHDALGRVVKAEDLNSDGSTYGMTADKYNVRDQVVESRRVSGGDANVACPAGGVCQLATMTYDGYGRLSASQAPDETAPTVYAYNADDTIQQATDARGVATAYTYNGRHLLTGVGYTVPTGSNVPPAPAASYAYDAAGNRAQMTDGAGSVSYSYDALSRLQAETRFFTDFDTTPFTLTYEYNLAGGLTSLTDPFNARISYNYDPAGRLLGVSGSGAANAPVYAAGLQYRAWGAVKHLTYGNNITLDYGYNERLEFASFTVAGRNPTYGTPMVAGATYTYEADGSVRYAKDLMDGRFDSAYQYDQFGRLQESYSGVEARVYANQPPGDGQSGPYRQSYQYDVWNNMVRRSTRFWSMTDTFTAAYDSHDRNTYVDANNPQWQYDAAGNVLRDKNRQNVYDAAGRPINSTEILNVNSPPYLALSYDGDGQQVKQVVRKLNRNNPYYPGPLVTTYPIHSSVLGGAVITELTETGGRRAGYVYAGSALLASEQGALVKWQHRNPVTGSLRQTRADTSETGREELDPEGVNLGTSDPALNEDAGGGSAREREGRAKAVLGGGADGACFMDFMAVDCAQVYRLLDTGVAVQCPNNDCGPRVWDRVDQNGNVVGREFGSPFRAYADGFSGFLPPGARYVGGGVWENLDIEEDDYRYGQLERTASLTFLLSGEQSQNPVVPPFPDPINAIMGLLEDDDCNKFVTDLINKAHELYPQYGALSGPVKDYIGKINFVFEAQYSKEGEFLAGLATGYIKDHNAKAGISPLSAGIKPTAEEITDIQFGYALTGLHETLHHANEYGFSDNQLADAAFHLIYPKAPASVKLPQYKDRSLFWDAALRRHCGHRGDKR